MLEIEIENIFDSGLTKERRGIEFVSSFLAIQNVSVRQIYPDISPLYVVDS